ncbi:hypothetical protein [Robiginitalea marina]|uniref:C4-dicarboxylate ABC transporter n=1 Tax=Robiginitalea marina TaxID=2954105 RepID=A0ABT1B056_9FLAO|nr:hypothetical protein [Robiginitalea marina]MCO5725287.1 hypothetical protein [Robiginitalea marina]
MKPQRILAQALAGGLIYLVISLVLERSFSAEAFRAEGVEALIFALVYGLGLWVYYRFIKKTD